MMSGKFALQQLSAEGFRGIGDPLDLVFDPRATLLVAPNGSGKTSILGSIEWALFGELHDQPRENATNDELVNVNHHPREASVRLELTKGDDVLVVERTKPLGKRASALSVTFSDIRRFQGDEAEQFLFQQLGLTFEDFYRAVYLHQESIRGLLVDEPRVRNESLDRLFGVDKLRDMLRVLSPKTVREEIKAIEAAKDRATAKLQGSIDAVNARYARAIADAQRDGVPPEEISLGAAAVSLDSVVEKLSDAALRVGYTESVALESPSIWQDLDRLARRAREMVRAIRQRGIELQLSEGPATALASLTQARAALNAASAAAAAAGEAFNEQISAKGSADQLELDVADGRRALADLEAQGLQLGVQQRVVAETIAFLRIAPDTVTCPACGQPVDAHGLLTQLQGGLEADVRARIERLHDQQTQLRAQIATLEADIADVRRAGRITEQAQSDLEHARAGALAVLGSSVPSESIGQAIEARIHELETASAKAANARSQAEALLSSAEAGIERVRIMHRYLQAEDERNEAMERLGNMDSDQSQADAQLTALGDLEAAIEMIGREVQSVAGDRARVALDGAHERIAGYYADLCDHPYFDRLRVAVEEQRVAGTERNNYVIRAYASSDGQATLASSRLSTAQMNCAALSIYLALASGLEHNLGFVLLDDPSQSLDIAHEQALARLLAESAEELQLVVATQDTEFGRLLSSQLHGATFGLSWSPRCGTSADG